MKRPNFVIGASIICLGILGGTYIHSTLYKTYNSTVYKLPPKVEDVVKLKQKDSTSTVANWIIQHSTKISDNTARNIAVEVFKYPHPILLISLIEVESEFVPSAVSSKGAAGLGQIMYDIHKKDLEGLGILKRRDLFDIDKNVKATSFVLQMMLKKDKGDIVKALHSYLGGKDGKYVARIFSNYVNLSLEIENEVPNL
jgi:hypothetical protein